MAESRFRPADIIPIQIRENLVVRVHGIPHDLSTAEADKIIGVIRAMATPDPRTPAEEELIG